MAEGGEPESVFERKLRTVGFLAGPPLALLVYLMNPGGHPPEARRLLAIITLTIAWWMTEALLLPAASLVSSALAIALGVAPIRQVLAPYADPVIYLFLGSMIRAGVLLDLVSLLVLWGGIQLLRPLLPHAG